MKNVKIAIVGAGFSGSVIARKLAEAGFLVDVIEERDHVAGNCFTRRDTSTGIMVHNYGPHIFHTPHSEVWDFVTRFALFEPYVHRVKASHKGKIFSLPVNLHTLSQYFGKQLSPSEAQRLIEGKRIKSIIEPKSFEEQAHSMMGEELYEAFFRGYTEKQWGMSAKNLPASILKRLPMRFNFNDNYFEHRYQGLPTNGYTDLVSNILDHSNIDVFLNTSISASGLSSYDWTFWSGPIDEYFDTKLGSLNYRTLDFETKTINGDFQGCAQLNYVDLEVPYTRVTEHKHLSPWESHDQSVVTFETSRAWSKDDIRYYPVRLVNDGTVLLDYLDLAKKQNKITFVGRLGTYRYLDMDATIKEALETAELFIKTSKIDETIPSIIHD